MVQLLGALFGILLLRLLAPEDYGKIAMLMVFANLANTLQESGFIAALCNLKNPTARDYNAVFWFNVGMGGLLYLILFFCAPLIAEFYGDATLIPLSRYLFLGFLISSLGTVQRAYLFIHLMNRQSCIIAVSSVLVSNVVGVLMAWMGCSYWALATQHLLFIAVVAILNWCYSPWRPSFHIDLRPAWQMFGFSGKLLFTYIVNVLSSNIFGLLLGRLYGDYMAGIYSTARKWTDMGANTIDGTLKGVAQPVLSRVTDDRERYRQVFRKMLRLISFVSFPALLGVGLVAREFLLIIAGTKWEESASLLSLLCIYGAIYPLLTLYSQMTISRGKSNINMWCTIGLSVLILSGLILLRSFGLTLMVKYFVTINVLWLFVWQWFAWRLIGLRLLDAVRDVAPFMLTAAAVMALVRWSTSPIQNLYLLLATKILLAAGLYLIIIWLSGAHILREAMEYLTHKNKTQ